MSTQASGPWWAALTIWAVVNAVNILQAAGFLSRLHTGGMATNRALGYVMATLALPAVAALVAFVRAKAGWLAWVGPAAFLAFVAFMVVVDYVVPIEFRAPARPGILVPYLGLFFGAILLMGLPMFSVDRRLWLITVASSVFLVGSMMAALCAGGA